MQYFITNVTKYNHTIHFNWWSLSKIYWVFSSTAMTDPPQPFLWQWEMRSSKHNLGSTSVTAVYLILHHTGPEYFRMEMSRNNADNALVPCIVRPSVAMVLTCRIKESSGLILGFRPANERWCYFAMTSLIGWGQLPRSNHGPCLPWWSFSVVCYLSSLRILYLCLCLLK